MLGNLCGKFTALGHLSGLSGLFVAGIFSGSLSSVSSTLNSLAAVTLEDYFKPLYRHFKQKEWKTSSASVSKIIAFVYGLVCIGGAFLAQFLGGILQASLVLFGVVGGPLLSLFTLGMATEIANQWGVIPATVIGIGVSVWIGFSPKPPTDRQLEFSTEDCSEFGGILKNSTVTEASDDKK
jgi:solute carrier family 5 (sodium-coupled monocarboxylate transporter), member 8/12